MLHKDLREKKWKLYILHKNRPVATVSGRSKRKRAFRLFLLDDEFSIEVNTTVGEVE